MSQNIMLDPKKKDYVFQNGSPISTDRILEACYYAILVPSNWMYISPGQGSLNYTLLNRKRNATVEQDFASFSTDAINRQLIDTGKATDSQISNIEANSFNSSNQVSVVPSLVQLSTQFNFLSV